MATAVERHVTFLPNVFRLNHVESLRITMKNNLRGVTMKTVVVARILHERLINKILFF